MDSEMKEGPTDGPCMNGGHAHGFHRLHKEGGHRGKNAEVKDQAAGFTAEGQKGAKDAEMRKSGNFCSLCHSAPLLNLTGRRRSARDSDLMHRPAEVRRIQHIQPRIDIPTIAVRERRKH
jgi:hypothetical protein